MSIIRLCRTFPRLGQQGVGLNCYNMSRLISAPTVVFTKHMESPPIQFPKNVELVEIKYQDLSFTRQNESLIRTVLIYLTKIYGEFVFALQALFFWLSEGKRSH